MIKRLVNRIDDELHGAESYAEKMIESAASGDDKNSDMFKHMAEDEMRHATQLHQYAVTKIENLRKIYTPPQDMLDKWETSHNDYVSRSNAIRAIISI